MTPHTIPQTVLFPDLFDKPLVATFNQEHASSDGGAVLLKAAERVYGLVKAFARCLADKRALFPVKVWVYAYLKLGGQVSKRKPVATQVGAGGSSSAYTRGLTILHHRPGANADEAPDLADPSAATKSADCAIRCDNSTCAAQATPGR